MNNPKSKHLLVGFALGLVVAAAVAAAVPGQPVVGRFQLGATHDHAFVIDTQTGQVWKGDAADFEQPKTKIRSF